MLKEFNSILISTITSIIAFFLLNSLLVTLKLIYKVNSFNYLIVLLNLFFYTLKELKFSLFFKDKGASHLSLLFLKSLILVY
jgi:hypothetical protein